MLCTLPPPSPTPQVVRALRELHGYEKGLNGPELVDPAGRKVPNHKARGWRGAAGGGIQQGTSIGA